jgi:DNA-binding winged helix-turn-helix (wHTH) protein
LIYRFDSFELDKSQYRLSRGRETVHVKPSVLELLALLVEHRDRVVSKAELVSTIWQGRFVSDNVLSATIYEARHALGEDAANSRFIKTVHARGYQFHFRPVEAVEGGVEPVALDSARAFVQWPGGRVALKDGENAIGRDSACAIVLQGREVSRRHARILVSGPAVTLEDLGSKNGTKLNGVKIAAPTQLEAGDVIEIGDVALGFHALLDLSTVTHVGFAQAKRSGEDIRAVEPTRETPALEPRTQRRKGPGWRL